jgi:hypothetical protein
MRCLSWKYVHTCQHFSCLHSIFCSLICHRLVYARCLGPSFDASMSFACRTTMTEETSTTRRLRGGTTASYIATAKHFPCKRRPRLWARYVYYQAQLAYTPFIIFCLDALTDLRSHVLFPCFFSRAAGGVGDW